MCKFPLFWYRNCILRRKSFDYSEKLINFAANYSCMLMMKRLLILTFSLAALLWLVPVAVQCCSGLFLWGDGVVGRAGGGRGLQ